MRIVVQRVSQADVCVDGQTVGAIGRGLLLLVGFNHSDTVTQAEWSARKIAGLRIFGDDDGKMNLSVKDAGGEILVVSQFTLYADVRKGRRPAFIEAADPSVAEPLYLHFIELLEKEGVVVKHGRFGARMQVNLVNDGPVTIIVERGG